ncbi:MAG: hypothetical protein EOP01_07875 [Propionibacteriaceae bacterium]|nr:MAG: hypothetical protein EOP01_07875 [Propionibacteriaceae bacterium]
MPTCTAGVCGVANAPVGTAITTQTAGDCKQSVCDGNGGVTTQTDDMDKPVASNACAGSVCTAGVPSNPPAASGTPCTQGGKVCDGAGACVACVVNADCTGGQTCAANQCVSAPTVASTSPADGATGVALPAAIAVTFSTAMSPTSLASQTASGPCTGAIQVSNDDFATCVGFATAAPTLNAAGTVATLVPAPGLLVNATYKIRVTTAAQSTTNAPLAAAFTQATGFSTKLICDSSLVISQVYGGGGNTGALFKNDFVELHNRGTSTVNLASNASVGIMFLTSVSVPAR